MNSNAAGNLAARRVRELSFTQSLSRACLVVPDKVAVIDGSLSLTWRQFGERARRLAGAMQRLGMQHGERVAILANNCHQYLELYYGVPWGGGIFVPLNFRLAAPELTAILVDSGAQVLLVDDNYLALAQSAIPGTPVKHLVYIGKQATPPGMLNYEDLLDAAETVEDAGFCGDDVLALFYTSGSTAAPKGVMHTHNNLMTSAMAYAAQVGLGDHSVYMLAPPLFHVGAAGVCVPVLVSLGTAVVVPRFEAGEALGLIQQHRISVMGGVPTILRMLIDHPNARATDLTSMESIIYGGAPMTEALIIDARKFFPNARFFSCFGMTESTASVTALPPVYSELANWHLGKANSIGRALIGCEVAIVDSQDKFVPPGTTGEIVVRGPLVMKGYWNKPELTAQTLRGGWLHTGDAGHIDDLGLFYIDDRLKDMIISGGENVYSLEVESVIASFGGIAQVAVIGIPHDKWGEAVHAIVSPSPGVKIDPDALMAHCRSKIAGYKCPQSIDVRSEPLPLSGANKINKQALRAPFWTGRKSRLV